ncbi:LPS export ABC transporter ATP-binding protein [Bdellovibrio bacteriovorus]|uniref:ABC transporter ATP-binding protein n=1 Tax=Bdellovibrio bacteriovorus TaxID=959 RepID=A0A150WIW6_BDEBC|nr:LPS export ABC transporter ATP-binding protein [Bdellovibrio bacteriovorus]KYG61355.1 ABC transporter ATP-binding protein [Bdellovibrio bacteriovorus]KYG63487.1 ABC transporter ATP-binding protein [Bdellovibrio bacteriovorus]
MSMLTIKDISKSFKKRKVVDGVSFSVESGQVVGLLGPNGAGKTTSFYMVVGLVQSDSGTINIDETNISSEPMYRRARVGLSYLAQEPSIFRKLTVAENITVALEAHGYSGAQRSEKLEQLIGDFHVGHIRDSYGYALSGGERRRVEIARALAGSPKFLLLDEPFAGIDPIAVADIQNIIRDLKAKGIGVLITDHNVRETLGICDYAYILKDGKIQVSGSSDEIANSELARKFYLGENFKL